MSFRTNIKLGGNDVYVIGHINDIEYRKEAGKLAWKFSGSGQYIIHRLRGVRELRIGTKTQEFPSMDGEFGLDRPIAVRSGNFEIFAYDCCASCGVAKGVVRGLCPPCAEKSGLKQCELCQRWERVLTEKGLCSVCSGKRSYYPWVSDSKLCQLGFGAEDFHRDCFIHMGSLCHNCPFLGNNVKEPYTDLWFTDETDNEVLVAGNQNGLNGPVVVIYNFSQRLDLSPLGGTPLTITRRKKVTRKVVREILRRINVLHEGGVLKLSVSNLETVKQRLEELTQ